MENKNTFPFQSNIYVESEVRPPAIIGYIYAPEEGDSMSLCESAEKAAVDFLGYPEQSGNKPVMYYMGQLPKEFNPEDAEKEVEYQFIGLKYKSGRQFYLFPKTI